MSRARDIFEQVLARGRVQPPKYTIARDGVARIYVGSIVVLDPPLALGASARSLGVVTQLYRGWDDDRPLIDLTVDLTVGVRGIVNPGVSSSLQSHNCVNVRYVSADRVVEVRGRVRRLPTCEAAPGSMFNQPRWRKPAAWGPDSPMKKWEREVKELHRGLEGLPAGAERDEIEWRMVKLDHLMSQPTGGGGTGYVRRAPTAEDVEKLKQVIASMPKPPGPRR
jgi:hypothetical protein